MVFDEVSRRLTVAEKRYFDKSQVEPGRIFSGDGNWMHCCV